MKREWLKKTALFGAAVMLSAILFPAAAQPVQAAKKATVDKTSDWELGYPCSSAYLGVKNPSKKSVYSATISDEKTAVPAGAYVHGDKETVEFTFRLLKAGSAKVTFKERTGKKTRKVGTTKLVVKKGKKCSAEITLAHAVTADELKASDNGNLEILVQNDDYGYMGNHGGVQMVGKIKKGSKKVRLSLAPDHDTRGLEKGKTYCLTGLKAETGETYLYKLKCK